MKIKVKESSIICPKHDAPNEHIWLSNIDIMYARLGHTPILYLYRSNGSPNFFEIKLLKEGLKEVLVPFYPVAGRLGTDENGRIQINCNGEGVPFIEAESDFAMGDTSDFTSRQRLFQLIPKVDYSRDISSYPLLLLQVTKFTCGGISIGIRWHHIVADGSGFLHFFTSWADIVHGLPTTILPSIDRTIYRHENLPTPTFKHPEYHPPHNEQTPCSQTILKITANQITTLKAALPNFTTYEILTAHTWRCTTKARGLPHDQETKVYMTVGSRSRLHPRPPPGYFGNLILRVTASALSGEITSEPLMHTAKRIHEVIKEVPTGSSIDTLELKDKTSTMKGQEESIKCPNLKIISWTRLPFYHVDFGWGKPVYMRAGTPGEGAGYILSSPNDDGTLLLSITLETAHIQYFEKLFYGLFSGKEFSGISRM